MSGAIAVVGLILLMEGSGSELVNCHAQWIKCREVATSDDLLGARHARVDAQIYRMQSLTMTRIDHCPFN